MAEKWSTADSLIRGNRLLTCENVEVMPPHANRRVTVPGPRLYFRDRTHDGCTCRDGIRDAVADLVQRTGVDEFTTGQVAEEMMAAGTS